MHDALARQQAGDLVGAAALYEDVLAQHPGNFDATHMLGVVRYLQDRLPVALELLTRAASMAPGVRAAQVNLDMVREAARLRAAEAALGRAVLPRLAPLCAREDEALAPGAPLDVLVGDRTPDDAWLDRLSVGRRAPIAVHRPPRHVPGSVAHDVPLSIAWSSDSTAVVVLVGLDESLALFGSPPDAHARMLIVTRDAPDLVQDRLRELSAHGRHRVHVRYVDADLARSIALPGALLAGADR